MSALLRIATKTGGATAGAFVICARAIAPLVEGSQLLLRMAIDRQPVGGRDRRMLPSELGAIRDGMSSSGARLRTGRDR